MESANPILSYFKLAAKFALLAAILIAARHAGDWVMHQLSPHITPSTEPTLHRVIMVAILIYVLLTMLPFVPGVEIGLGMIAIFGTKIVPLVYGGTVLALVLAFVVGRIVPERSIANILETLHFKKGASLIRHLTSLDAQQRLQFLLQNASSRITPFLVRHRFIALMLILNIPGNAVIGGGGGICMMVGFSRLFSFQKFVLTVALAVTPVPIMLLLVDASV